MTNSTTDKPKRTYKRHDSYGSLEYHIWVAMKQRCLNPRNKYYRDYGERGISVCDRWLHSFTNFTNDMGQRPSLKHSLDRIDNNAGYSPDNCRWATWKEQNVNRRDNYPPVTYRNETHVLTEWAEIVNISYSVLKGRLKMSWPIEEILTRPVRKRIPNRRK